MKNSRNRSLSDSSGIDGRYQPSDPVSYAIKKRNHAVISILFFLLGILVISPAMAAPFCTVTPDRLYADSNEVFVQFSEVDTNMLFDILLATIYNSAEHNFGILVGELQTDYGLGYGYIEYFDESLEPSQIKFSGEMPGTQYNFLATKTDSEYVSEQFLPIWFGGNFTSSTDEELIVIPIESYPLVGILCIEPYIDEISHKVRFIPYSFDKDRPDVTAEDLTIEKGKTSTGTITLAPVHDGLVSYNMTISLDTPGVAQITNAYFPAGVTGDILLSDQSVTVNATCSVEGYIENFPLINIIYNANGCCATGIVPVVNEMTDENGWPVDPDTVNGILSVTGYNEPVAAFEAGAREFAAPGSVTFRDMSTGSVTDWLWRFGDGYTSTDHNPVHLYNDPGTYTVNLTVSGPTGSDSTEKQGYIKAGSMPLWFYANITSGTTPFSVQFNATSVIAPDTWSWYFGDGEISGIRNATHTYSKPGDYTIRLTATTGAKSNRAIRYNYIRVSG